MKNLRDKLESGTKEVFKGKPILDPLTLEVG